MSGLYPSPPGPLSSRRETDDLVICLVSTTTVDHRVVLGGISWRWCYAYGTSRAFVRYFAIQNRTLEGNGDTATGWLQCSQSQGNTSFWQSASRN